MLQQSFGGFGGVPFDLNVVRSIGIRHGDFVDALVLNGIRHGGTGGVASLEHTLEGDDYINQIDLRCGGLVDYISFKTKAGVAIAGGGGGGIARSLSNIRVLRLGGRSGGLLDQINIEYVQDYQASTVEETGKPAVFAVSPPGSVIQEFQEKEIQTLRAYESIYTTMLSQLDANGSVDLAMNAAKMNASLSVTTDTKVLRDSIEERKKTSTSQTINVPSDAVALLVGAVTVMRAPSGTYWLKPEVPPSWLTFKQDKWRDLVGYYDVTGRAAATQIGLKVANQGNLLILQI